MILDLIAAVIITFAFYKGYSNGLLDTVVNVMSILIGLVIALHFSPLLIDYLQDMVNINPGIEFILGFLIVFFVVMLGLRFLADRLEGFLKTLKINFINQLAGGVLLGLVASFCVGGLLILLTDLKILNSAYSDQSTLYGHLITLTNEGSWLVEGFKNIFSEFWSKFMMTIDQVKDNIE